MIVKPKKDRVKLTFIVSTETYRRLMERMKQEGFMNLSEYLRYIVRKYLGEI